MNDVIVIGGGVNGAMAARELTKAGTKVLVLEKNADLAQMATGANSAIIHNGADPEDGTLKAKFNLEGAAIYPQLAKDLGIDYKPIGSLVVATNEEEIRELDKLEQRARSRKIPVERLNAQQLHEMEPNLADGVIDGLLQPTTAIVTPWQVAIAGMEEALLNGAELELQAKVSHIERKEDAGGVPYFEVTVEDGRSFEARKIVNAAGVFADEIAGLIGTDSFIIRPKKGEYYVLSKFPKPIANRIIYPVPSSVGKGILCTPTIHGNTLLGPNSFFIDDKEDVGNIGDLDDIKEGVAKIIKDAPYNRVIRKFAGNRPVGNVGDFVVEEDANTPGFIHIACIESPGLSSAPAIAQYVAKTWFGEFEPKEEWISRAPFIQLNRMDPEEKAALQAEDPLFAQPICLCEQISEGEIVDVIRRKAGARTVDGVKKRCRPGMGPCQGKRCRPKVISILARELGIPEEEVILK